MSTIATEPSTRARWAARALALGVAVTALAGCHRGANRGPLAPIAPPPPAAQVASILASHGYTCAALDDAWQCTVANDPRAWPLVVSTVYQDQRAFIWIDSYATRAFGQRCAAYTNHMLDLNVPRNAFSVSCDDGTQSFRMNTVFALDGDADATAWAGNHVVNRTRSVDLLASVGAIRGR